MEKIQKIYFNNDISNIQSQQQNSLWKDKRSHSITHSRFHNQSQSNSRIHPEQKIVQYQNDEALMRQIEQERIRSFSAIKSGSKQRVVPQVNHLVGQNSFLKRK